MSNATRMGNRVHSGGFTLIEVMIVVVVIGILASIAWPSYQNYVKQTRRADAQAALMELAHHMERYYTNNGKYTDASLPFSQSPKNGGASAYTLSLAETTASAYRLQAVPVNSMNGDECGTLTLDSLGRKGSGGTLSMCWKN